MSVFEASRMTELLKIFRSDIISIEESISAKLLKQANKHLNDIYTYHLSAKNSFTEVEDYLKNLYRLFNYAAAIIVDALKKKTLEGNDAERLGECMEIMLTCCDKAIARLSKNKK